jgi:hypothetical protein
MVRAARAKMEGVSEKGIEGRGSECSIRHSVQDHMSRRVVSRARVRTVHPFDLVSAPTYRGMTWGPCSVRWKMNLQDTQSCVLSTVRGLSQ